MIETKEGRYFETQWFIAGDNQDFFAALYRDTKGEDKRWVFQYRFRYYNSPDPLDDKDLKSEYVVKSSDKKQLLKIIAEAMEGIRESGFAIEEPIITHFNTSNQNKISEILLSLPYVHVRPTSPGGDA